MANGIWLPGTGSPEAEKRLECQRKAIDDVLNRMNRWRTVNIDPVIKPYVDPSRLPSLQVALPDFVQYWNCGVRTVMKSVAEFEMKRTFLRLSAWSQKTLQSAEERKPSDAVKQ